MITTRALQRYLLLVAACLSVAPVCAAPDDTDLVVETDEEPAPGEIDPAAVDNWIFPGFENAEAARSHIEGRASLIVSEVVRLCELTTEQNEKLRLAANIEVRHVFDDVERLRERFITEMKEEGASEVLLSEAARFQTRIYRDLLGEGSFFAKTVQLTVGAERRARFDEVRSERLAFQREAAIEAALVWFEESVPLTGAQYDAITVLINDALGKSPGGNDSVYVFYRVLSLPVARLREVLDERQWKAVAVLDSTRTEYEQMLISQGSLSRAEADAINRARQQ